VVGVQVGEDEASIFGSHKQIRYLASWRGSEKLELELDVIIFELLSLLHIVFIIPLASARSGCNKYRLVSRNDS
jgi:hypothetical protein